MACNTKPTTQPNKDPTLQKRGGPDKVPTSVTMGHQKDTKTKKGGNQRGGEGENPPKKSSLLGVVWLWVWVGKEGGFGWGEIQPNQIENKKGPAHHQRFFTLNPQAFNPTKGGGKGVDCEVWWGKKRGERGGATDPHTNPPKKGAKGID